MLTAYEKYLGMKLVKTLFSSSLFVFFSLFAQAQDMKQLIDENFQFAAKQYKVLAKNTPANEMPRSYNATENKFITSDTKWWTSGFYPGTLWLIYEQTHDNEIKIEADHRLSILEKEKYFTGNHDIGFMIFCSFGNAYRITGKPEYKPTIDTAAKSLITRYRPYVGAIQSWSWGNDIFNCPVIIDNMMNLELLCWVSDNSTHSIYRDIAIEHADATLKNHFRSDNSCYHVVDYNERTGQVIKKGTWQGLSNESSWARGQAWALYGYTMMYRMVKDIRYLEQAQKIAHYILSHPNMPEDGIPYWDFDAPNIPDELRDVSAASITASALLELGTFVPEKQKEYKTKAELMIRSLSSNTYRAKYGTNGGFMLKHSVGSFPHKSEIDVPLTYADYYFIEALKRYKDWYLKN